MMIGKQGGHNAQAETMGRNKDHKSIDKLGLT